MNIEQTLKERGARYGDFTDHARICQDIKYVMSSTPGWSRLSDVQKQALEVIADKQARILNGDPDYIDNWHDIIGYAKLVEDRLHEVKLPELPEVDGKYMHAGMAFSNGPGYGKPAPTLSNCDCAVCRGYKA